MKNVSAGDLKHPGLSWDELFDSEDELLSAMMKCPTIGGLVPRGFGYIEGFQRYYKKHGCLTPKQMSQLKRMAKFIYAYVNDFRIGRFMAFV